MFYCVNYHQAIERLTDSEGQTMCDEKNLGFETRATHIGNISKKCKCHAVSSVYEDVEETQDFSQREFKINKKEAQDNVYKTGLEKCLASLENAKYALVYPSGMAAVTALTQLIDSGSHVVCADVCYGGTFGIFTDISPRIGIDTTFVDTTKTDNVIAAIRENTKVIWVETVSNPLLYVTDIGAIAEAIKDKDILLVVDNTFLTPYYFRPLESGAHVAMHSATKYLNGHTDVTMGTVAVNDKQLYEKLKSFQQCSGNKPSSFDCSLVHIGLKTLSIRMRNHMENSLAVAKFLEAHPAVDKVLHPFLPSHPQNKLAKAQQSGHSGMVSFYLKGSLKESEKFLKSLKVIELAVSLGGVDSLIQLPYLMVPEALSVERRLELGLTPSLVRFSVGIESIEDLINDLDQALEAAFNLKISTN